MKRRVWIGDEPEVIPEGYRKCEPSTYNNRDVNTKSFFCRLVLPLEDFPLRTRKDGVQGKCTKCRSMGAMLRRGQILRSGSHNSGFCRVCREWFSRAPKQHNDVCSRACTTRAANWLYNYGLTATEYWEMWDKQGGLCAMPGCLAILRAKGKGVDAAHIDHCHSTGKIRKLLCQRCNVQLGGYEKMDALGAENYVWGSRDVLTEISSGSLTFFIVRT